MKRETASASSRDLNTSGAPGRAQGARRRQREHVLGLMAKAAKKRNKYGAVKTQAFGFTFDSGAEAKRYGDLRQMEKLGYLMGLDRQIPFTLLAKDGGEIGKYIADFAYWLKPGYAHPVTGQTNTALCYVVEDVKGRDTRMSAWKRKHVKAQYGIDVQIVRDRRAKRERRTANRLSVGIIERLRKGAW